MSGIEDPIGQRGRLRVGPRRLVACFTISVVLVGGIAFSAVAQETLQGLGFLDPANPLSFASGISGDGGVVVGVSYTDAANHFEAFRWQGGTMTGLGFLDPGNPFSFAYGVSYDGTVVVGASFSAAFLEAFRWQGGTMIGLGFLDPGNPYSYASGASGDGTVVVGASYTDAAGHSEAFRWQGGTMTGLGFLDPGNPFSAAQGVSYDGKVVVGISYADAASHAEAFRWQGGTMTGLGFLDPGNPGRFSDARAVSGDGTTVVGASLNTDGHDEAFRWKDGTMTGLGFLDPGNPFSSAYGVSYDGSTVVGEGRRGGASEAFRWTNATGMKSIADLLTQGGVDLTGWQLEAATGVSANGVTVVGSGLDPSSKAQAWIARVGIDPGFITPGALEESVASLGQVPLSVTARLNSLVSSEADFAEHNGCTTNGTKTPYCAFAIGSANEGLGITGLFGAAFDIAPGIQLGIGGGYGVEHADLIHGGNADLRFPTAGAFLAHVPDTGLQAIAAASAIAIDADIDRGYMNGSGSSSSSGSTNGNGYGALARIGWAFQPVQPLTLTPFAEYAFARESLDGYTETGGPFPASIGDMKNTVQTSRIGAEARYAMVDGASLWSSLDWAHRFGDASPAIFASIPDLFSLTTPANGSGSDWLEASAGIKVPIGSGVTFNGSVTLAAFSQNTPAMQGDIGLGVRF